jgi:hypothetical protein
MGGVDLRGGQRGLRVVPERDQEAACYRVLTRLASRVGYTSETALLLTLSAPWSSGSPTTGYQFWAGPPGLGTPASKEMCGAYLCVSIQGKQRYNTVGTLLTAIDRYSTASTRKGSRPSSGQCPLGYARCCSIAVVVPVANI